MSQTDSPSAPPKPGSDLDSASARAVSPQLRFFQLLSGLLLLALLSGVGLYFYHQRSGEPITVLVSGKPVATVANIHEADRLTQLIYAAKLDSAFLDKGKPQLLETLQLQRADSSAPLDTTDQAVAKLAQSVHVTTLADSILIDGKAVAALPDKDTAQAALDAVRKHYADMPPEDPVTDKPDFEEKVTIDRRRVQSDICKASPDQVAEQLITAPPAKLYTVQAHQTGWAIARKFHMSFTDFIRANSGHDLDHLKPGDTVNISQTYPALTVIVHKESSTTESIVPGAPLSAAGERRVTSIATYINGVRTGSLTPVSVYTLQRAKPGSYIR